MKVIQDIQRGFSQGATAPKAEIILRMADPSFPAQKIEVFLTNFKFDLERTHNSIPVDDPYTKEYGPSVWTLGATESRFVLEGTVIEPVMPVPRPRDVEESEGRKFRREIQEMAAK